MTPSEVRQKYETETGKRWYVYHPSDLKKHNATIPYASWDYQLWLEKKVGLIESLLGWIKLYEQKDVP